MLALALLTLMVVRQCGWTCSRSLRPQGGGAVEENQQNMVDFFATFPQPAVVALVLAHRYMRLEDL